MLLKSVSDIGQPACINELERIGYDFGLMNMMQIYLQVEEFTDGVTRELVLRVTAENALDEIRRIFSLAIINLACCYHEKYEVPSIEPDMAVVLKRSYPPDEHLDFANKYLDIVWQICDRYHPITSRPVEQ